MWFSSWLRNCKSSPGARGQAQRRSAARRFRPRLEALEDRWVPSTLTVTNNLGYGVGSLRNTIAAAQSGDTIVFDPSLNGQTIDLTTNAPPVANFVYSQLVIDKNLDIEGPGAGKLGIDAGLTSRVFEVLPGVQATIAGLTIKGGDGKFGSGFDYLPQPDDNEGGGILNHGRLTLQNCAVSGNSALLAGGGIYSDGTMTLAGCTVSADVAGALSRGVGGGIYNAGAMTLTSCTVTGNTATFAGGGIDNATNANLTLDHSTVTGNSPDDVYDLGKFQHNHSTIGKVVRG